MYVYLAFLELLAGEGWGRADEANSWLHGSVWGPLGCACVLMHYAGCAPGDPAAPEAWSLDPAPAGDPDADTHGRIAAASQPDHAHHATADTAEPVAAR